MKEITKKRKEKISPIGFVIGNKNLFLTNNDGKMIVVGLESGKIIKTETIAKNLISEPFIFNKNLFVIKNGSIIQYN